MLAMLITDLVGAQEFKWLTKVETRPNTNDPSPVAWSFDPKIEANQGSDAFYLAANFRDTVLFSPPGFKIYSESGQDFFLAHSNNMGVMTWVKQFKGNGDQTLIEMEIDAFDNIYLAGEINGQLNFDGRSLTGNGMFILKFDKVGNFIWSKIIAGDVKPTKIINDTYNNLVVTGEFTGSMNIGCTQLDALEVETKFVVVLGGGGNCQMATTFVASSHTGVATNGVFIYLTGGLVGTGVFGEYALEAISQDAYVATVDYSGDWHNAVSFGGEGPDEGLDIEVDYNGNAIVAGSFSGTMSVGNTITSVDNDDVFVALYDAFAGFKWARAGKGPGGQFVSDIEITSSGRIVIGGTTNGDTDFGNSTIAAAGDRSFIAAYDSNGENLYAFASTGQSGNSIVDLLAFQQKIYISGQVSETGNLTFGSESIELKNGEMFLTELSATSDKFEMIVPEYAERVWVSHAEWVDYDNDNDLDFIVTGKVAGYGNVSTAHYNNEGHILRRRLPPFSTLPAYGASEIAFLNLNSDEKIDIMFMGERPGTETTNRISLVENTVSGFIDKGSLPDFGKAGGYGSIAVGDIDNDGLEDIFVSGITGYDNGSPVLSAFFYLNENGSYLKSQQSAIIPLYLGASRLTDIDNDRDLDLIMSGSDNNYPEYQHTKVYHNDGEGNFTLSDNNLIALQNSSIDLFDIDGDSDLDLFVTGYDQYLDEKATLYQNDGSGHFSLLPTPDGLNRTAGGSADFGDYDNDGDADILITGGKLAVFINNDNEFSELHDDIFPILADGDASWGDYNKDGQLDILASGRTIFDNQPAGSVFILINKGYQTNSAPEAPANFDVTSQQDGSLQLQWDRASDDITPSSSLTYNLSIKDGNTNEYILHPYSSDNGFRQVARHGNMMLNNGWNLSSLSDGTYVFRVQSIDGALIGSAWSEEKIVYHGEITSPSQLEATAGETGLYLSWRDNSMTEEFFVIEKKTGDAFEKYDSVASNVDSYLDLDAVAGNVYRVYAVNPSRKSAYSNETTFTVTITGIEETPTHMTLYPNPASSTLMVGLSNSTVGKSSIAIRNANGVQVASTDVLSNEKSSALLDVSDLPAGLYIVEIISNEGIRETQKFMKQ